MKKQPGSDRQTEKSHEISHEISSNDISIGSDAPDFELKDQDGKSHKLSDYKGKDIVLYFYPKDDTPGCTKQACDFRDNYEQFRKKGIIVIGVSVDDERSHRKFADKYSLPFILLADPEKKVVTKYGVWGKKNFMGKAYMGTTRSTFIIGKDFKIRKVFPKVSVIGHVKEIIAAQQ